MLHVAPKIMLWLPSSFMCLTSLVTSYDIHEAMPAQSSKLLIPYLIWVVASSSVPVTLVAIAARCININ